MGHRYSLDSVEKRQIFCSSRKSNGKKPLWRVQSCSRFCLLFIKHINGSGFNNLSETLAPFLFVANLKIFGIGEILICHNSVAEDTSFLVYDPVSFGGVFSAVSKDFIAFTFMV